ncbi:YfhO family protein [Listeria sp. ILCC792]|uniref:YfhO family protein n=1 Tax=Listeria sp. ILCC792 TaxID=1918331 RepID=UPI000B589BC0|nr:YfhO family protein [Listeria sp. ILCC792]
MKKIIFYSGSFCIPFGICCIVFYSLHIVPFGDQAFLVSDIGSQYMQFLHLFHNFFTDGFSLYSFSNGIGDSVLSLSGYYLASPFNLISLMFNEANMPIALSWMMILKISAMGFSMSYYLAKHYKTTSYSIWLFSTAYSFCGFTIAYGVNYMWLDALVLLPFVVLGLEKIWLLNRGTMYVIALFLTIVTNYYLGYMVCLFAVIYSLYLYAIRYKKREDWRFRTLLSRGKKFVFCSLFAGLATSFILIPSILGMLNTEKTNFAFSTLLPYPKFFVSFLSQFGVGTIRFDSRLDHLPTIYSGILITLFFIMYFLIRSIPKREKLIGAYLFLAIFATFIIELFNTIWHMFQAPAGFPYRQSFIFSFLIIAFAYKGFLHFRKSFESVYLFRAAGIFIGILIAGEIGLGFQNLVFKQEPFFEAQQVWSLLASVVFIGIYVLLLLLWAQKKANWLLVFLALLLFFELGSNYRMGLQDVDFGKQHTFSTFSKNIASFMNKLNPGDELFRVQTKIPGAKLGYVDVYNGYNDAISFHYAGTSAYTSTLNKQTLETLKNLGLYSKNERRYSYVDANPAMNLLLNVRYQISYQNDALHAVQNAEAVGSGFFIADGNIKLRDGAVFSNLESVLQGILPNKEPYLVKTTEEIVTRTSGDVLMYLPNAEFRATDELYVNGKLHQTNIAINSNQLYNLGFFKKGEKISVMFKPKKRFSTEKMAFYTLDEARFQNLTHHVNSGALQLTEENGDHLSGTVTAPKGKKELFLSIPYDKAWQIKIDGKNTTTSQVMGNFTSISVPEGKHQIALSYRPKIVPYSILFSILVIVVGLIIRRRQKK